MYMKLNIVKKSLWISVVMLVLVSCQKEWEDHYYTEPTQRIDLSINDYLASNAEFSIFSQMLAITGYDKLLSENQTFTVWAPVNSALEGFDLTNEDLVLKTVRNHITRFGITSSRVQRNTMVMLNNKRLNFERTPTGLRFGGRNITQSDIALRNGMVHVLNGYVPYVMNIWEYIAVAPGIDSLRNYINSLTRLEFDVDASFRDGVLIDSVFTLTNRVLTRLGYFEQEDSAYTVLLPDNQAWNATYQRILPLYRALEIDGGVATQVHNAQWMLVRDLFFNDRITVPLRADSIRSTAGTRLSNANALFPATPPVELSNGFAHTVSELKHLPEETWNRVIRVEAENAQFGRTSGNYEITTLSSIGTGFDISGGSYINARATSTLGTARLFINFPIPNTLAGRYNIYCVFVPTFITDTTNLRPYRLRFSLNYDYVPGVRRDSVWVGETAFVRTHTTARQFTTNARTISKVRVISNYQFPFSNLVRTGQGRSDLITSDRIRVGLRVENAVGTSAAERFNFNRDIRIDCILLVPVE